MSGFFRPWVLFGAVIGSATCWSCSDSDHVTLPSGIKGGAGEAGAATESGTAGAESSASGGPTANAGDNSGPGSAGSAGEDSAGGATAGAAGSSGSAGLDTGASAGGGSNAGGGSGTGEALTFCPRLISYSVSAFNVTRDYDHAVFADCRVKWVTSLYLKAGPGGTSERDAFLNDLLSWSVELWGCQPPPVDTFALIYQAAPLTSADAKALIDDYVSAATTDLTLSTAESDEMRAALGRLSQQTIAANSSDYSHSSCGVASGTSGTAGSGGTAGSSAGTGGSNP